MIEREYEMDEARVLAETTFDPPPADASNEEKRRWLRESFWELCSGDRDYDGVPLVLVTLDKERELAEPISRWHPSYLTMFERAKR